METTAKLFKNGRSQAVRLPKAFNFEGTEVFIKRIGDTVILSPQTSARNPWDVLLKSLDEFTPDFMAQREQPEAEERDEIE